MEKSRNGFYEACPRTMEAVMSDWKRHWAGQLHHNFFRQGHSQHTHIRAFIPFHGLNLSRTSQVLMPGVIQLTSLKKNNSSGGERHLERVPKITFFPYLKLKNRSLGMAGNNAIFKS
jgi:hypothetical protein